jgi:hypothetical protein
MIIDLALARRFNSEKENVMNEKNEKPPDKICIRVKPEEFKKIYSYYFQTDCHYFSEYARLVLLQKPVVILYRNHASEEALLEMIQLKKALNEALKCLTPYNPNSSGALMKSFEEACLRLNQIYELWYSE